ncbi:MAG: hypothetical protein SGJ04_08845 [Bacteroidota bacterium]|nr:hypothetical protein [Bacteroidota bacterium]
MLVENTCLISASKGAKVITYTYNASNKLISAKYIGLGEIITTNKYGIDGKISEMKLEKSEGYKKRYRIVHLNNVDQYFLSTQEADSPTYSEAEERVDIEFTKNKVTKISNFKINLETKKYTLASYKILNYTGENVTEIKSYNSQSKLVQSVSYTYDDKKNPYKGLLDATGLSDYEISISSNNIKHVDFNSEVSFDITYEYNTDGNPTKVIIDGKATLISYNCK